MGSYVGIDLHWRRSVVVVLNEDGDRVSWCRIDNSAANLAAEVVAAGGREAGVAMEATWGWYWAADVIAECGARLHLAQDVSTCRSVSTPPPLSRVVRWRRSVALYGPAGAPAGPRSGACAAGAGL